MRANLLTEFQVNDQTRLRLTRINAGRRLRGLPPLPVPAKLERPLVPVAYETNGDYVGRIEPEAVAAYQEQGYEILWEAAKW